MNQIVKTMMDCLKYELCAEENGQGKMNPEGESVVLPERSAQFFASLFCLSKKHDLAHLVGNALNRNGLLPVAYKAQFERQIEAAVYRCERILFESGRIFQTLEEEKIPFLPLKGAVMQQYYPQPWMRTRCDIDVLVQEKDAERAKNALIGRLHYRFEGKTSHDMQFFSQGGVHFELHYALIEDGRLHDSDDSLSRIWDAAEDERANSSQKKLTGEMFYYYHVAHMAKHFLNGGCGVKPFVDLFLLERGNGVPIDGEKRDALLRRGGLLRFAKAAGRLSRVWLGTEEHCETTRQMEQYVLQGGVYGTMQNRVAVQQVRQGGKLQYAFFRIWMPYDSLKFRYPTLEKHKWLLPFFEIRRWLSFLSDGGAKRGITELSWNNRTTEEESSQTRAMLRSLGLDCR